MDLAESDTQEQAMDASIYWCEWSDIPPIGILDHRQQSLVKDRLLG